MNVVIPSWMPPLFAVLFGACIGSFLNVCIYRLPRGESVAWPGSRCTSCGRALTWYDNIPILSWVTLGGRCRTCKASVSAMYPIVEAVTALAFLGGYLLYGLTLLALVRILFACALIVLFVTDLAAQDSAEQDHTARDRDRVRVQSLLASGPLVIR